MSLADSSSFGDPSGCGSLSFQHIADSAQQGAADAAEGTEVSPLRPFAKCPTCLEKEAPFFSPERGAPQQDVKASTNPGPLREPRVAAKGHGQHPAELAQEVQARNSFAHGCLTVNSQHNSRGVTHFPMSFGVSSKKHTSRNCRAHACLGHSSGGSSKPR